MPSKKKKYIYIYQIRKVFSEQAKNFALFVHMNHMNIFEFNNLKAYCLQHNIYQTSWKLNLLKKMTKNNLFLSLLKGPTRIFFFNSIVAMLEFVTLFSSKTKIIPLAIYWQANFYSYEFFSKYVKNLQQNINFELEKIFKNQLVYALTKNNMNLIFQFKNQFINVWNLLEAIKNSKKQ